MEPEGHVVCRVYTRARRHPNVIGVIGGWTLPWPLTPTQLGVLLGSFAALMGTRQIWSIVLPGSLNTLVLGGGPIFLCWAVRHLRMEGRSPMRMAAGAASYLVRPRQGTLHGRPYRIGQRSCWASRVFVGAEGLTPANQRRRRGRR
ncbi:MAG: TcpE family conjugal transfer membrane protein [Acidimicrobiia bacterium]